MGGPHLSIAAFGTSGEAHDFSGRKWRTKIIQFYERKPLDFRGAKVEDEKRVREGRYTSPHSNLTRPLIRTGTQG